jgi:hypothetical protein
MTRLIRYSNEPGTVKKSFHHLVKNRKTGTYKKEYRLYPTRLFGFWRKKTPGDKSNTSFYKINKGVPSLFFETELTAEEAANSCDVDKDGNYYMLSSSFQDYTRSFDKNANQRWLSSPKDYGAARSVCYAYFNIWVMGDGILYKFDIDTGELIDSFPSPVGETPNLLTHIEYCMAESSIVFAYDENLIKFDLLTNTYKMHTSVVPGEQIFAEIVDQQGNIYIGYYNGGVVIRKMDYDLNLIWEFNSGLGNNNIVLAVDKEKNVYFSDNTDGTSSYLVKLTTDENGNNPTQEFRQHIESDATNASLLSIVPALDDGKIFMVTKFPSGNNFFSINPDGTDKTVISSGSVVGVDMITSRGRQAVRGKEYVKPLPPSSFQVKAINGGIRAISQAPENTYERGYEWYVDGVFAKESQDVRADLLNLNTSQKYDISVRTVDIFGQLSTPKEIKDVVAGEVDTTQPWLDNYTSIWTKSDSQDSHVDFGEPELLKAENLNQFTIELWFQTLHEIPSYQWVFGHGSFDFNDNFRVFIRGGGDLTVYLDTEENAGFPALGLPTINVGQWYHIAVTYDGDVVICYLGGSPTGSDNTFGGALTPAAGSPWSIGQRLASSDEPYVDSGDRQWDFRGYTDEVRVWNTVRSEAEINETMNMTISPISVDNLIAYWPADEGRGDTLEDKTSNEYDGLLRDQAEWSFEKAF